MVEDDTHQQMANQRLSASGVSFAGPSVDAVSWVGSGDFGVGHTMASHLEHHQLSTLLPHCSSIIAI
jgi:hypothetical protein